MAGGGRQETTGVLCCEQRVHSASVAHGGRLTLSLFTSLYFACSMPSTHSSLAPPILTKFVVLSMYLAIKQSLSVLLRMPLSSSVPKSYSARMHDPPSIQLVFVLLSLLLSKLLLWFVVMVPVVVDPVMLFLSSLELQGEAGRVRLCDTDTKGVRARVCGRVCGRVYAGACVAPHLPASSPTCFGGGATAFFSFFPSPRNGPTCVFGATLSK